MRRFKSVLQGNSRGKEFVAYSKTKNTCKVHFYTTQNSAPASTAAAARLAYLIATFPPSPKHAATRKLKSATHASEQLNTLGNATLSTLRLRSILCRGSHAANTRTALAHKSVFGTSRNASNRTSKQASPGHSSTSSRPRSLSAARSPLAAYDSTHKSTSSKQDAYLFRAARAAGWSPFVFCTEGGGGTGGISSPS